MFDDPIRSLPAASPPDPEKKHMNEDQATQQYGCDEGVNAQWEYDNLSRPDWHMDQVEKRVLDIIMRSYTGKAAWRSFSIER